MSDAPAILLAEDDEAVATVVQASLEGAGHIVQLAVTRGERDAALAKGDYKLLITDVVFPDGDGLDTLDAAIAKVRDCRVIVLSAQNTLDTAVRAARHGAYEYLPKPFDLEELLQAASSALSNAVDSASVTPDAIPSELPLVGRAPAMQALYRIIARLADNDLSVLINGESGTGKELVARAIHQSSRRAAHPFVAINMAAIPRELIESELFGHEKGAFTGADTRKEGRFSQADGGTLFLDEIGDMPIEAQTRLLRVLQSGEFNPVGSTAVSYTDVRIVAATNRLLDDMIAKGRFREDLFYRLNVVPLSVPALRDRRSDIPALCRYFLSKARQRGLPEKTITPAALKHIERLEWSGNVRELENFVYRMCVLARGNSIGVGDIEAQSVVASARQQETDAPLATHVSAWLEDYRKGDGTLYEDYLATVEPPLLDAVLTQTGGNQLKAAARLGINRNTLRKRLAQYGLRQGDTSQGSNNANEAIQSSEKS